MTKEVLQDALELLAVATFITPKLQAKRTDVINAGLQALAEQPAQQEPVAWREFDGEGGYFYRDYYMNEQYAQEWDQRNPDHKGWVEPLYTSPPAQQEPLTDIYRSFEQWKSGNVLEHGVPRTEFYTKADLDLVEMGWNYGHDAGRAVEQALDKMAENARELGLDYEPAQQEPTCKQDLQVWVQRTGQFSWEPQDERFWTRMQPAHHTEQHLEMVANQSAQQEPVPWSQALENVWAEPDEVFPPAQRTWVDLTPQNLNEIFKVANTGEGAVHLALKLIKEKNT